jgi:AmmeMemoRadiSam system protein A
MNDKQQKILLKLACDTVEALLTQKELPKAKSTDADLKKHLGCFVTLKNNGRLRGCIGQFVSDRPLIEMVCEMAKSSATGDPRFFNDMITAAELDELDVEISVLSELVPTDNPASLRPGVDGIYIKRGLASGCFLPQVATEMDWDAEEFLSYCCSHKAGLASDAWKDPKTDVYLFTADIFGASFKDIRKAK